MYRMTEVMAVVKDKAVHGKGIEYTLPSEYDHQGPCIFVNKFQQTEENEVGHASCGKAWSTETSKKEDRLGGGNVTDGK